MSKRTAQWQGGEERYGGPGAPEEMSDRPQQATAAQLAKRKIAQAKGTRRPRSESPMPSGGSIFDQANQNGFLSNNNTAPSNPFSAATGFSFNNNANANGSSQSFGSGGGSFTFGGGSGQQTQQSTPTTNTSFQFGNAAPSSSFTFGGSPAPQSNGFVAAPSFGGFAQPTGGGLRFGDNTPKATTPTVFEDNPTPKPSNPFGTQTTSTSFGAAPTANGSTGFNFTGSNTFAPKPAESQASSTTFGGFGSQPASTQPEKPASDGWSSFLGAAKPAETPKPATNGFTPSTTSLFGSAPTNGTGTTNGTSGSSIFAGLSAQAKTPSGFTFTAQPVDNDASMISPENTPQKPNGVQAPAQTEQPPQIASKSLFERITSSPPKETAQPASSLFGGSLTPAAPKTSLFAPQTAPVPTPAATKENTSPQSSSAAPAAVPPARVKSSMDLTKQEHFASLRELNESLLQHLKTQDLNKDLSSIFQYYQTEAAKIVKPSGSAPSNGMLSTSSTAADASAVPSYPKLPETASNTAKFFQATLDGPAASTNNSNTISSAKPSTFTPSTTSLFAPKSADKPAPTASLFGAKPAAPATNGFTPSTTSLFTPKPAEPAAQTSGGFIPKVPASGSSFMSAFGEAAAKNAAAAKKRRRDEEFDSEEDDPEEWERKDNEAQAAKLKAIEDAAKKPAAFTFKPTPAGEPPKNMFSSNVKLPETTSDDASADHTWKQGTPIKFGSEAAATTTAAAAPKFNLFGAAASNATPSKGTSLFGAASATPSNGPSLFGAAGTTSSNGPSLFSAAKPAATFSFGQASTAAPASSTPTAESADQAEEGDAAPPEPQLDDLAVLLPAEKEENDVLLFIPRSKSRKLEARTVDSVEKMTWIDKGRGPIWILRNKATGKTRVLQKVQDSGRAAMNFSLLKGDTLYKHEGMNGKSVMALFIDHLAKDGEKASQWAIIVGKKEDAAEVAKVLNEEQAKISV